METPIQPGNAKGFSAPLPAGGSPLHAALAWWESRDAMGGFITAAASLFPGWQAKRSCRAPHREDRAPSFSLYRNKGGQWRFKDHATGEQGGLVAFVMLAGMGERDACRWLMENGFTAEAQRRGEKKVLGDSPRLCGCSPRPSASPRVESAVPYRMSDAEIHRCHSMAQALAQDRDSIARIATARGWQPKTIHDLARQCCIGLHEGRLVMIYPTGAKKRLKPLENTGLTAGAQRRGDLHETHSDSSSQRLRASAVPFTWLFGKPDALWLGDRLMACTERVHITEGETDAINLIDAGCDDGVTEIVMAVPGASCWRDEWAPAFSGKSVTLWPDPDEAGQRLLSRMIASLSPHARQIETAAKTTIKHNV